MPEVSTVQPPLRWHACINYRTAGPVLDVHHDFEELDELHDLVERGPDWNAIESIVVTLARTTGRLTLEASDGVE
jgi:hypothetical protein